MSIRIQSIHFDADKKLLEFVEKKAQKLVQFFDKIISTEVFLKLDKDEQSNNKVAEIKIAIPGQTLFAKAQCKTFEEATDEAVESLKKQIVKHKEKIQSK